MSEARTPEEGTIDSNDDEDASQDEAGYEGPDPESDPKGDGSDEDQGI